MLNIRWKSPLWLAACLLPWFLPRLVSLEAQAPGDLSQRTFDVTVDRLTPIQALIQFGMENHVPMGIVLGSTQALCGEPRKLSLKRATIRQVTRELLAGSDYSASIEDGVVVVKPNDMPETSGRILTIKHERFGGMKTTMQGLGILLAASIHQYLHPTEGFAGNIMSGADAENVPPFVLSNATTEQIADHIVTLEGKGAWILFPPRDEAAEASNNAPPFHIYGYSDDRQALSRLSCAE